MIKSKELLKKNNNKQEKTKGTLYRKTSVTTNPRYLTFEMENFR